MFNKIKNFLKKYKLFVLITVVFLILLVLILLSLRTKTEEDQILTGDDITEVEESAVASRNYDYPNYKIEMSSELLRNLQQYEGTYRNYKIALADHLEWAENFVEAIEGETFRYEVDPMPAIPDSELHYLDQTQHFWLDGKDEVFYDVQSDLLYFYFETPVTLSDVQINTRDKGSAQKSIEDLSERFFSGDFGYRVNEISREGNYYRIEFSRLLAGSPIYLYDNELYLLVTPDGRLKQGKFLLAEFREDRQVSVFSSSELYSRINSLDHSKSIVLTPVDPRLYEEFGKSFFVLSITGEENANINLEIGEIVYYYTVKFQEEVVPQYLLNGSGDIDIKGDVIDVNFEILTDAISEKL